MNDFLIGSSTSVGVIENETLESQTDDNFKNPVRIVDESSESSACQNQVVGKNFDDKIRKAVDNAVRTVENRMHEVILTAMDNVMIPRVEKAVKSFTG